MYRSICMCVYMHRMLTMPRTDWAAGIQIHVHERLRRTRRRTAHGTRHNTCRRAYRDTDSRCRCRNSLSAATCLHTGQPAERDSDSSNVSVCLCVRACMSCAFLGAMIGGGDVHVRLRYAHWRVRCIRSSGGQFDDRLAPVCDLVAMNTDFGSCKVTRAHTKPVCRKVYAIRAGPYQKAHPCMRTLYICLCMYMYTHTHVRLQDF